MISSQRSMPWTVSIRPISTISLVGGAHGGTRVGSAVAVVGDAEGAAALAVRPVARPAHQVLRLLDGLEHRHHDAARAGIQHRGDRRVALLRHPHPDGDVEAARIGDLLLDRLDADAAVLGVEHHPFAAGGVQHRGQARREELEDHGAEGALAGGEALAQGGLAHLGGSDP